MSALITGEHGSIDLTAGSGLLLLTHHRWTGVNPSLAFRLAYSRFFQPVKLHEKSAEQPILLEGD